MNLKALIAYKRGEIYEYRGMYFVLPRTSFYDRITLIAPKEFSRTFVKAVYHEYLMNSRAYVTRYLGTETFKKLKSQRYQVYIPSLYTKLGLKHCKLISGETK